MSNSTTCKAVIAGAAVVGVASTLLLGRQYYDLLLFGGKTKKCCHNLGPTPSKVVVVGSGVIGLTIALCLARRGYQVAVYARDLPSNSEDLTSQDWASPWAGANWCPFGSDPRVCIWETEGLARLEELIPSGLAMRLPIIRFASNEAGLHNHWYENVAKNYRRLSPEECPEGSVGVSFDSVSVNAPAYCQWLYSQAKSLGVTFTRKVVRSLASLQSDDVSFIVNATGLGALYLEDVKDQLVEPIRGQVLLVRAPEVKTCVMDSSKSSEDPTRSTYVIPRPNSGGQVICGGCYEVGSFERAVNPELSASILDKCLVHFPKLATKGEGIEGIEVIRECVGFRPSRKTGPRLEMEYLNSKEGKKFAVVHAYGIGPAGYQASWGMAKEVCELIAEGAKA